MKNRLIILLCFMLLGKCLISFGQESLINNREWNRKIKENYHLSPFYYGITKTKAQIEEDSNFVRNEVLKFETKEKAFENHYVKAWNYYNVGIIDTATIEFNKCFLIDKKNGKAITGLQYTVRYLNGLDINLSISDLNKVLDHLDSLLILREYSPLTYSVDVLYIKDLQQIHKEGKKYAKLPSFTQKLQEPYSLDSNKYILVKMRFDDDEGYFKVGLKDDLWKRYRSNSSMVMFDYEMHYGIRHGKTRSYDKNGIIMKEFIHVNGDIEGEYKYFDEKGELVRIAYWKNNQTLRKNDKVYKQVPVEGDIVREKDKNGKIKEYIIKDREKVPLD